jgi:hypothetical protein
MSFAYHAIIGNEEIRVPPGEIDRFREAVLVAARDGSSWVPLQLHPTRRIEVLITPHTSVRIETIDLGDAPEGDDATDGFP